MKAKNKKQMVIEHLKKYKNITSWEAITEYKATRLSAIIFNLRKTYNIISENVAENKTHYTRYIFKGIKK